MVYEAELTTVRQIGQEFFKLAESILRRVTELESRVDLLEVSDGIPLDQDQVLIEAAREAREELLKRTQAPTDPKGA